MLAHLVERLQKIQQTTPIFNEIKRGIERECLRVTPDGELAKTPHHHDLGSKLTHPLITTDYSENLLELITPAFHDVNTLLANLHNTHVFTAQTIQDERLWAMSMPCMLGETKDIPIADYGTSHSGQMKMHYRRGLEHRYGRHMQSIAGLHYNFSLPPIFWKIWHEDFDPSHNSLQACINANYMRLVRNYLQYSWLIFMLMGASPACHRSFFQGATPDFLTEWGDGTLYAKNACSLRMSGLGYQSDIQEIIQISYASLERYANDLLKATQTPSPTFAAITKNLGKMAQLNDSLLQIEAELYAPIRPKQPVERCERPVHALLTRGIQYIEIRALDINPLEPLGINAEQIHFMDTFLLFCLLENSPSFTSAHYKQWLDNEQTAVLSGLSKDCILQDGNAQRSAQDWGAELFEKLAKVATLLDTALQTKQHEQAIKAYAQRFQTPETLPAYQQIEGIKQGEGFIEQGIRLSEAHHDYFMQETLDEGDISRFKSLAATSHEKQTELEALAAHRSYQDYLDCYYSGLTASPDTDSC